MEDSGIDSGDKVNSICFETEIIGAKENNLFIESDNSSNDNVEVVFRNPNCISSMKQQQQNHQSTNKKINETVDSILLSEGNLNFDNFENLENRNFNLIKINSINHHNNNNLGNNLLTTSSSSSSSSTTVITTTNKISKESNEKLNQINSCKVLQRKLELKVERAKRNYNQLHEEKQETKPKSCALIPITRLQIPGCPENVPLVEYNSENSEDDDDDEISFFPAKTKLKKQDLSDTFSIQEMTIESDTDDSESQNLELLPPTSSDRAIEKVLICLCCIDTTTNTNNNKQKCTIM